MTRPAVEVAFTALEAHVARLRRTRILDLFAADPKRFDRFHVALDDLIFDFSKHLATDETIALLTALAEAADLSSWRARLFAGAPVNATEGRAALHMALRNLTDAPMTVDGRDVMEDVRAARRAASAFAEDVRDGRARGAQGAPFRDIVNIGIGGSDLGPAMAARALSPYAAPQLRSHFVANVDGADLGDTLQTCDLARTLFIVSSKTFTTQETMANAAHARAVIVERFGAAAVRDHFAAVSTQVDAAVAFGVARERVFGFWDWVGGRYSLWSSIGLPLLIAIGPRHFEDFLRGGQDVDDHFRTAPLARNIPVLMGLLGVLRRNLFGESTHAVIPYDQRLARFPAYLQQLDMESNGKTVTRGGAPVARATGPFVFGEPGTNGQHAFFQLLHQGAEIAAVDFLVAATPTAADADHHALLVANCLAQSEALMRGRSRDDAREEMLRDGRDGDAAAALAPHKTFPGDRPSSTFLYRRLDPRTLGRLVALYEHKVFVQSVVWDINPFDQWGVELGKALCGRLAPLVRDARAPLDGLDGSTAGLIAARRRLCADSAVDPIPQP